jgi:hypothetical protein
LILVWDLSKKASEWAGVLRWVLCISSPHHQKGEASMCKDIIAVPAGSLELVDM